MNSGKLVILVIPSIIALIFSVFVTIGIIGDISTRADRAKILQQKYTAGPVIVLMPPPPIKFQIPPK
jgi:hypothetical protein